MLFLFSAEKQKYAMRRKCVTTVSVKVRVPVTGYYFFCHLILHSYDYNKFVKGLLPVQFGLVRYFIKLGTMFTI